ncbi:MAG: SGNH/GDSL hydrolase family protein [Eubacteriales bacterium]|nr:SGNH/GDSL hydrolase family protein [Eubacteriales bacterium]
MKKLSKLACSLGLTAVVLAGTILAGCAETTNYTEEIKQYQAKLEELEAENAELRAQLGIVETETPEETEQETGAQETETQGQVSENDQTQNSGEEAAAEDTEEDLVRILVLGDSIWGNYRDDTGVAARVEHYMEQLGRPAKVYNAAIGGTRATIDPQDNEWEYGPASESSLGKMTSILSGNTDVELLQGKAAYDEMKAALQVKDQIDYVIIAYGMNDFLSQVPINDSDRPWTGYGTALVKGVGEVERECPNAQIMIVTPTYASYFSIPVQNMGEKALYNYASVACDVAKGKNTLCVDAYNNMGIDAYNADEYLEDGVHLNEKGRDLYARNVVSCLVGGVKGVVSGNNILDFD